MLSHRVSHKCIFVVRSPFDTIHEWLVESNGCVIKLRELTTIKVYGHDFSAINNFSYNNNRNINHERNFQKMN